VDAAVEAASLEAEPHGEHVLAVKAAESPIASEG